MINLTDEIQKQAESMTKIYKEGVPIMSFKTLTTNELEDALYNARNLLNHERHVMSDANISKIWNRINNIKDELSGRESGKICHDLILDKDVICDFEDKIIFDENKRDDS